MTVKSTHKVGNYLQSIVNIAKTTKISKDVGLTIITKRSLTMPCMYDIMKPNRVPFYRILTNINTF